jgi:hypothetical protein
LSATWFGTWNRASDAPYTISDGVSSVTVDMDQRTPPNDISDAGAFWERVTTFTLDATQSTLTVRLSDDADGYVIADGVRLEQIHLPKIEVTVGGARISSGQSNIDFGQAMLGDPLIKTFTVANQGVLPLILEEPISVVGNGFTASGFGDTTLAPGETTTFTVTLTATTTGSFAASLSLASNDLNENPFEFDVSGNVAGSRIVDDKDPGWSIVSGAWNYSGNSSSYFQNDHHYRAPGSGSNVVQWEFTGLEPAATYQVSATWFGTWNRANDAPYTISDGVTSVTVDKDQGNPPDDFTDAGASWELLTTFTMDASSSTLTIQLSDDANGYVIADAIRIVRLEPLQASGHEIASSEPALEASQAATLLQAAAARWLAAGLDASSVAVLLRADVMVIDLAGPTLGLADAGSQRIWLDANAAGYGWFVDATPLVDEEFTLADDDVLKASAESGLANRVDLLTVLAHELGHLLGLQDLASDTHAGELMADRLSTGVRRLPRLAAPRGAPTPAASHAAARAVDQVFAGTQSKSVDGVDAPTASALPITTSRKDRQAVFAEVDEILNDFAKDLCQPLDEWLLDD